MFLFHVRVFVIIEVKIRYLNGVRLQTYTSLPWIKLRLWRARQEGSSDARIVPATPA